MKKQVLTAVLLGCLAPVLRAQTLEEAAPVIRSVLMQVSENRIQRGPILVVEKRHKHFISQISIVVETKEKKDLILAVLQSGFPEEMGVDTRGLDLTTPRVMTVDEYIEKMNDSQLKSAYRMASDGVTREPIPDAQRKEMGESLRKHVLADLGNNLAVAYRYIGSK